jgi:hypothetical protein
MKFFACNQLIASKNCFLRSPLDYVSVKKLQDFFSDAILVLATILELFLGRLFSIKFEYFFNTKQFTEEICLLVDFRRFFENKKSKIHHLGLCRHFT